MTDLLRALWPPILLKPWFLWLTGAVAILAGVLFWAHPEPLVRLSVLSDPKNPRPSPALLRKLLAPSLFAAGLVTLWFAWMLQSATR